MAITPRFPAAADIANLKLSIMSDDQISMISRMLTWRKGRIGTNQVAFFQSGTDIGVKLRPSRPAMLRLALAGAVLLAAACSEPVPEAGTEKTTEPVADKVQNAPPPATIIPVSASLSGNYLAGIHARTLNDSAAASKYMDHVLAADPNNAGVKNSAFILRLQNGDVEAALPLARQLQQAKANNQLIAVSLISDAFKKRDFAQAKSLIADLDRQGLGELLQPLLGAWALAGLGEMDAALAELDPATRRNSFQPFYLFHRALMAALTKQDKLAEQYFTELLDDAGNRSIRAAQAFGLYLETRDQYPRAAEIYRGLLQPINPHPILSAALARTAAKQPAQLLISDATAGAAEVLYGLSSVLSQDSEPNPLPLLYLRLAIHMRPDFEEARMLLAGVLEGLKRHDDAIAIYEAIPDSSAQFETARIQIANNADQAGRTDDGIAGLRQYIAKYPDRANMAQLALADLLRSHERYADAIPVYDKVIAALGDPKPHHWQILYARGITYERAGEWPKAESDLLHALELEPEQPNVLNYLAYSWIDKGLNIPRAKVMIENAARQRPEDGAIIDSLGWIQYRIGEFKAAVETLENAISLMPQDAVINDHLGDAYWQVGRRLEAQFQWQRALSFDPDPKIRRDIEKKLQYGLDEPPSPPTPVAPSAQKS